MKKLCSVPIPDDPITSPVRLRLTVPFQARRGGGGGRTPPPAHFISPHREAGEGVVHNDKPNTRPSRVGTGTSTGTAAEFKGPGASQVHVQVAVSAPEEQLSQAAIRLGLHFPMPSRERVG